MRELTTGLDMIQMFEYVDDDGDIRKELRIDFSNDTHFVTEFDRGESVEVVVSKLTALARDIELFNN